MADSTGQIKDALSSGTYVKDTKGKRKLDYKTEIVDVSDVDKFHSPRFKRVKVEAPVPYVVICVDVCHEEKDADFWVGTSNAESYDDAISIGKTQLASRYFEKKHRTNHYVGILYPEDVSDGSYYEHSWKLYNNPKTGIKQKSAITDRIITDVTRAIKCTESDCVKWMNRFTDELCYASTIRWEDTYPFRIVLHNAVTNQKIPSTVECVRMYLDERRAILLEFLKKLEATRDWSSIVVAEVNKSTK